MLNFKEKRQYYLFNYNYFLGLLLLFQSTISYSQISGQKVGGVCFRVDDTQQKQKWLEYANVFNNYGMKFCMGQCLDANLWDTAYISIIRNFAANGHEFMDHSSSQTTTSIRVLNYTDTIAYSGNPNVHHINGKKICLKYNDTINSFPAYGLIDLLNGNMIVSHNNGEFGNMYGNPYYFAVYIPALNGIFTYYDLQNKNYNDPDTMKLKSFWDESIILPDAQNLVFHKVAQYDVKIPFGSRKIIAERTVNLCNQYNLPIPKTWIHPGGSFPMLSKNEIKEVWGDLYNFTSAASYLQGSIKCYNEYDIYKDKRFGVMWGDFIEENWTMSAIKNKIADGIAKHYLVFGQSHFTNLTDGWSGYLNRMDTLLNWLQTNNIPVKTYHQWTSLLFDSITNPYINIFPQPNIDLDANGVPDGYLNATSFINTDGVTLSGNTCFSISSTGTICEIQNLAGLEKGNNYFSLFTKGSPGDSVLVKITFPEYSMTINKKVAADQINWTKYYFSFYIPDFVNKATFNFSVSNFSSGVVKISGFELKKISEIKIQKPNYQKINAHENFNSIPINPLIKDSLYSIQNINIQTYTQNSALIYNLDVNNILTVNKPYSFWVGKDSLKVVASNPDNTKDSSFFVFESVNPEICKNDSLHFQLSESFINVNWTSQPFDNTLKSGNFLNQTVKPLQNTNYNACCIVSNGDTVWRNLNVIVNNLPVANAGSDITKCFGDTLILSATGGIQYQWNHNINQDLPFAAITQAYYKVEVSDFNACKSSDSLFLNVLPAISAGIIDSIQPVCYQAKAVLYTSNSSGSLQWQIYDNQQWSNIPNANNVSFQTPNLNSDKTYRIKASGSFCIDKYSEPRIVVVNQQAIPGNLSVDSVVCTGLSAHLFISGHNADIEWQKSDDGISNWQTIGNSPKNDSSFLSLPIYSKTFFRAKLSSNNCPPVLSNIDSVVITSYPQAGLLDAGVPICKNASATLTLTGNSDSILWQTKLISASIWTDFSNNQQPQIQTNSLQNTTLVRVKVFNSICPAIYSNIDTINVFNFSDAGLINGSNLICQGSLTKLKLNAYEGNVIWQSNTDNLT